MYIKFVYITSKFQGLKIWSGAHFKNKYSTVVYWCWYPCIFLFFIGEGVHNFAEVNHLCIFANSGYISIWLWKCTFLDCLETRRFVIIVVVSSPASALFHTTTPCIEYSTANLIECIALLCVMCSDITAIHDHDTISIGVALICGSADPLLQNLLKSGSRITPIHGHGWAIRGLLVDDLIYNPVRTNGPRYSSAHTLNNITYRLTHLQKFRLKYDMRKFYFTNRVVDQLGRNSQ